MIEHNVVHLIAGLGKGGAETTLYQLLKFSDVNEQKTRVISLGASHYYEEQIRQLGIGVMVIPFWKNPIFKFGRLYNALRGTGTLCCWMYHASFIGFVFAKIIGIKTVIWNIRHSDLSKKYNKRRTLYIVKICARLSKYVTTIAYNGEKARAVHEEAGFYRRNGIVLNNGVDVNEYRRIQDARRIVQEELGFPNGRKIILSVARYHSIKDIPTFVAAFAEMHRRNTNTVAIICGSGIEESNLELLNVCHTSGLTLRKDIFLLGLRHDIPYLMSACDIYVLHSAAEAFPNTLVQAMACECVCLATDVGDARKILNRNDRIINVGDIVDMSEKMKTVLELAPSSIAEEGEQNRMQVRANYDIRQILEAYQRVIYGKA